MVTAVRPDPRPVPKPAPTPAPAPVTRRAESESGEESGEWEWKLAMARAVKDAGYPMVLNFVIHRHNIHQMNDIMSLCERLGADYVELATCQYYGWAFENREGLMPSKAQLVQAEQEVVDGETVVAGTTAEKFGHLAIEALEDRMLGQERAHGPGFDHQMSPAGCAVADDVRAASRAWASAVMSMPTGHHAIQRPQPTQPDMPNWSCQWPSLWVIHCR